MSVEDRALLPYLSAHTRQSAEEGLRIEVTSENWRPFALSHRSTLVSEKLDRVLRFLGLVTSHAGEGVDLLFGQAAPLFDAVSDGEVAYLVGALIESGYLQPLAP